MLWPLTITCIDESGNRLPGAAIQVRDNLNPSLSVDAYDSDYQLVASPVAGPTGMATVFLRNGYIDSRYVLDPYESEWITDLAMAPSGRPGRWRDDAGGTIAAGATTDFPITVPNLGIEKGTENVVVSVDMTHPHMEDLTVQLVRTGISVDLGGPEIVTHLLHEHIEPQAFSGVVTFEHVPGGLLPEQGDRQLLDAVSDTDTTFDINQAIGTDWPAPTYLRIGSEIVQVTAGATTTSPTVARGQLGTTAAAHDPAVDPAADGLVASDRWDHGAAGHGGRRPRRPLATRRHAAERQRRGRLAAARHRRGHGGRHREQLDADLPGEPQLHLTCRRRSSSGRRSSR
jgi:hypothetical protein